MATDVRTQQAVAPAAPISRSSRLVGYGSIFGKAIRDSRRAFLIEAAFLAGFLFVILGGVSTILPTQAARDEIVRLANDLGPAAGISTQAVNVGTIGGYIAWKYGSVFVIVAALWSILALTGTLAGEARRGSLEFVAAAPFGRRRIAFEKVAAHLTLMAVLVVLIALAAWLGGAVFAKLPADKIPLEAAVGFALWVGLMALAFGGLAFALAQFLGRSTGAWIAGFILLLGPFLKNYETIVPSLGGVASLTPWAWTWNHVALAGRYDWPTLVPVAIVSIVLLPIGIEAFARRDIGATSAVRTPGLPTLTIGLGGPIGRSFGERLPLALAWGIGLGIFGLIMAGISASIADELETSPQLADTIHTIFPAFDIGSAGGFLQLLVQLLYIVAGIAAATLVSGWASDETSGRLDMLLATPLARASWAFKGALGVFAAIAVTTSLMAAAIGIGAAASGSDAVSPFAGTFTLGLFAAAVAGVGFAFGGVVRMSIAAEVVMVVVAATYLIDLLAPMFKLPDALHQLALTSHLGQPMVGVWDWAGVIACVILAAGGAAIGAWGFARRDLRA
jgi:ABC-2 type transport system permease protein